MVSAGGSSRMELNLGRNLRTGVFGVFTLRTRMERADGLKSCEACNLAALLLPDVVLGYVGPAEHLYVSSVSKSWSKAYAQTGYAAAGSNRRSNASVTHETHVRQTSFRAAFASPSRVAFAAHAGFESVVHTLEASRCAGEYATQATLEAAGTVGLHLTGNVLYGAAKRGRLDIVQWLVMDIQAKLPDNITEAAGMSGSVELMQWLLQHGASLPARTMFEAAVHNHMELVQFMRSRGCPFTVDIAPRVAKAGLVEMLSYIIQNGCPLDLERVTDFAIWGNHRSMLQWLHTELSVEFQSMHLLRAAMMGSLTAVQFLLLEMGCTLTPDMITAAAVHCQYETFMWLLQYTGGECVPAAVVHGAIRGDCEAILAFALDNLIEGMVIDLGQLLVKSCDTGSLKCAETLFARGALWPSQQVDVRWWGEQTLAWAAEHGLKDCMQLTGTDTAPAVLSLQL